MLIVFEGLQACGKTTQLNKLSKWVKENYDEEVVTTCWNSYPRVCSVNNILKNQNVHTPLSLSLIHALDFNLRYEYTIKDNKNNDTIVLSDRYIYTAYVRDTLRNIQSSLINQLYSYAQEPDLIFYFDIQPNIVIDRMRDKIDSRSNYILGMDLNLSEDKEENFLKFLNLQRDEYLKIFNKKKNTFFIDGSESEEVQFEKIKGIFFENYKRVVNLEKLITS